MPTPAPRPSRRCSASPACPRPEPGWAALDLRACSTGMAPGRGAATLLLAQDWTTGLHVQACRPCRAGLGAPDAEPVRAGRDHARVLDRAQLARAPRRPTRVIRLDPGLAFGTGTHPTTRMCLRWIAQACGDGPWLEVRFARAGLRLRLGHPGHRRRRCTARAGRCGRHRPEAAVQATRANAQANSVRRLLAGLPDAGHGTYRWCWPTSWPRR
jgi:ribosomal protein L11 methyltransferase